jgi:hypothetical protein
MRTRTWLAGLVLAGFCAAWAPPPANAAVWPFSMFSSKKPAQTKKTKAKSGKATYNKRIKQVSPMH